MGNLHEDLATRYTISYKINAQHDNEDKNDLYPYTYKHNYLYVTFYLNTDVNNLITKTGR